MNNYWKQYWNKNKIIHSKNSHKQVGRTKFGNAINEQDWGKTVEFILKLLKLKNNHKILDLCAGNGILSTEISKYVDSVVAVDISEQLLESLSLKYDNIITIHSDVLKYEYPEEYFDKIILYFSAQHFSEIEITQIISKSYKSLKKGGVLYIGDVPDIGRRWQFYNSFEYRQFFFKNMLEDQPHIGTWFDSKFFMYLGEYLGFQNAELIVQPTYMINSNYRFDILYSK